MKGLYIQPFIKPLRTETEEGKIQENRYDAEGLRYEVRENANRIRFVYHQGELLYEKWEDESSYHQGGGIEAVWKSEKNHYYHQDEQLSTAFITNEKQEIQNHYQYDAFGNGICQEERISNRIRYTGQQYDGVMGQYYLRARYYNPIVGRFLQEDVYQGDGLNLYAYCGNNPVRYYDPSGYSKTPEVYNTGCPGATTNGDAGKKKGEIENDDTNEMFRRKGKSKIPEPIPKRQLQKIVKGFKRQGGIIQMDDVTDAYLESKMAEAITLNKDTILLRQNPIRSSVFEELIHATQFRQGLNDRSLVSRLENEIAAQKML